MMSFKSTIKNILPPILISLFAKSRVKKSVGGSFPRRYLQMGNSILQNGFSIRVINPQDRKYVTVGNDNMLDCQILFESGEGNVIIRDKVYIGSSHIICRSKIEFGSNIFVAWGVYFYDHDSHSLDYEMRQRDIEQQLTDYRNGDFFIKNKNWDTVNSAPIKICDNAWIGMNAIILKGVTIGEGGIVAAGSVVTQDVEPWTVVGGNPAKMIKRLKD